MYVLDSRHRNNIPPSLQIKLACLYGRGHWVASLLRKGGKVYVLDSRHRNNIPPSLQIKLACLYGRGHWVASLQRKGGKVNVLDTVCPPYNAVVGVHDVIARYK